MSDRDRNPLTPDASPSPAVAVNRKVAKLKQDSVPSGLQRLCRPKPAISIDVLNQKHPLIEGLGLRFHNLDEAKASMNCAQWRAPKCDSTIPQTDEEDRDIVKQLVDAFKDMDEAKDTANNAYRKRFTPGDGKFYSDWAIEACAWDILRMAKSIHTEGFNAPIYDSSVIDAISQTKDWSFHDRIVWICTVLKTSKYTAVTLMKNEKNWTTVGAPHRLYNSTLTNSKSNANRAGWIVDGRERDATHQGRRSKRQKSDQGASDEHASNIDTAIHLSTGVIVVAPQQAKPKKRKRNETSTPADTPGCNQLIQFAPIKPSPLSWVVAYPTTEAPLAAPATTAAPDPPVVRSSTVSRASSDNPDAHLVEALFGELPKGDETEQVQAAVGGDDTSNDGDDEDAATEVTATEDAMDVDDADSEDNNNQAAAKDFAEDAEDTTKNDAIAKNALNSDPNVNNGQLKRSPKTEIEDSDDELSDVPDDLPHLLDIYPAASKTDLHFKGKTDSLEPPTFDAATLEGARALAALGEGVGPVRPLSQS